MVKVEYDPFFEKTIRKIKDEAFKLHVKKQIQKIVDNPEIRKPMRYTRKGHAKCTYILFDYRMPI